MWSHLQKSLAYCRCKKGIFFIPTKALKTGPFSDRSRVILTVSSGGKNWKAGPSFLMFSRANLFIPFRFFRPRLVTWQKTISTMNGPMVPVVTDQLIQNHKKTLTKSHFRRFNK
jgi:hypothetical protein